MSWVYNYSFPTVIADEVPEARMRFELLVHPRREIRYKVAVSDHTKRFLEM